MKTIQILILIFSILDIGATYLYVSSFHNKFPTLDYTALEANPILRLSWRQWGLNIGTLIGGAIVFTILLLIVLNTKDNWLWFLMGVLSMMLIYHLLNFSQLAQLKPAP